MGIVNKLFDLVSKIVLLNDAIHHIHKDLDLLNHEVKNLDRRITRLETLLEFTQKHRTIAKLPL